MKNVSLQFKALIFWPFVKYAATVSQEDPQRTVQTFIDLIQRHEQAFYSFVHKVHSKGEGLFDNLMRWIELFLTVVREGLGEPISLEFLLPHTGKERIDILTEVDAVALYHYKLKIAYEDKIRRRFGKIQGQTGADAEDEAAQALVQGVVGEINFGELVQGDADDLAAEETDESDDSSTEYETGSESEESEESSEGHHASSKAASKPQTAAQPTRHLHRKQSRPKVSDDGSRPRQRSMSLKSSKSMTFNSSHRSQDVPPVPPVPKLPMSSFTKPLPPSPGPANIRKHSSSDNLSIPKPRRAPSPARPRKGKAKKAPETLKSPELHHIPQLLPVFTEMVSCNQFQDPQSLTPFHRCDLFFVLDKPKLY